MSRWRGGLRLTSLPEVPADQQHSTLWTDMFSKIKQILGMDSATDNPTTAIPDEMQDALSAADVDEDAILRELEATPSATTETPSVRADGGVMAMDDPGVVVDAGDIQVAVDDFEVKAPDLPDHGMKGIGTRGREFSGSLHFKASPEFAEELMDSRRDEQSESAELPGVSDEVSDALRSYVSDKVKFGDWNRHGARDLGLNYLGSGCFREVFEFMDDNVFGVERDDIVLKVTKDDGWGNEKAVEAARDLPERVRERFLVPIVDHGPDHLWMIQERADCDSDISMEEQMDVEDGLKRLGWEYTDSKAENMGYHDGKIKVADAGYHWQRT